MTPAPLVTIDKLSRSGLCKVAPAAVAGALDAACARFEISTGARLAGFLSQCSHESCGFSVTRENLNYSAARLVQVFPRYFSAETATVYDRKPERIAARVYGGRMGNGPEASGDGWRFRGRGYVQLTGRQNYAAVGAAVGRDVLANPDLLASPELAALSAAWFWAHNGLNEISDRHDGDALARAMHAHRTACYVLANPGPFDLSAMLSADLGIDVAAAKIVDDRLTQDETRRINGGTIGLEDRRRLYALAAVVFV